MNVPFACPKCGNPMEAEPPNGEWWSDCDSFSATCGHDVCGARLIVHVGVVVDLTPEIDDDDDDAATVGSEE